MLSVVNEEAAVADGRSMLDEICREGAQRMLAAALEAEVDAYIAELVGERDEDVTALWCGTVAPARGRSRRSPGRSRSVSRASTTAGSIL